VDKSRTSHDHWPERPAARSHSTLKGTRLSPFVRFRFGIVAAGIIAAVIGFGNIAGISSEVVLIARLFAGLCFLFAIVLLLCNVAVATRQQKNTKRDHRPAARKLISR
jgi:hypothetical protein